LIDSCEAAAAAVLVSDDDDDDGVDGCGVLVMYERTLSLLCARVN